MYRIVRYYSEYKNITNFLIKNHNKFYIETAGCFNNNIPTYILKNMESYCNKVTKPSFDKFINTIPPTYLSNACDNKD